MHDELKAVLVNRRTTYKLLARLYQLEVDEETLAQLKGMRFPEATEDESLNKGGAGLNDAVAKLTPEALDELAADYARTFLSAGVAEGPAAYPIESVYTSREHLIMQGAFEEVSRILAAHGLAEAHKDLYPDHLGVELEFMSWLADKTIKALEENKTDEAEQALDEQTSFLQKHLLGWTPKFFDDERSVAQSDFYRSLADFTQAWLNADARWLAA